MFQSVSLPLWLLVLLLMFAAASFLSHFFFPSVRWFFRRRMERAVEELNKRLDRPIQPLKLLRRQDQITRLIYDPHVMEAVAAHALEKDVPRSVAFEKARDYAREIVPGFSTAVYFGFATRVARALGRAFFTVHLGQSDADVLRRIDPRAAVVFVMNHRSNMDYVLVTWLAAERSALSYAAGEWARVWPLKSLIRSVGAYFIRRKYSSPLYRAVLARYVQMMVRDGVTQAMFPEGGLSLTGAVGPAKLGLLDYIVRDFDPALEQDVVFVPVALNYDRVLEDRVLIKAQQMGTRRFGVNPFAAVGWMAKMGWNRLRGRATRFGHAAVCYGEPVSLRAFLADHPQAATETLAQTLMGGIRAAVPLLPVPLAAGALVRAGLGAQAPVSVGQAGAEARAMLDQADRRGAFVYQAAPGTMAAFEQGLAQLELRGIVQRQGDSVTLPPGQEDALAYYAASALQRLDGPESAPEARAIPLVLPEGRGAATKAT